MRSVRGDARLGVHAQPAVRRVGVVRAGLAVTTQRRRMGYLGRLTVAQPMKNLRLFLALSILCVASALVFGKGPTTRIVLTAPGLASPIEIVDSNALSAFAVWSGPGVQVNSQEQTSGFIADWAHGVVTDRPNGLPRYEVSFYAKYANRPLDSQQEHLSYVVLYEPDRDGGGYVYLPGKGDPHYALNVGTIFRGHEGQWFHATDAWNRAVRKALGGSR